MYVVVIDGWQEATPERAQALSGVLGVSAYEARQRLLGGGPVVIATCAEAKNARGLGGKLQKEGFGGFVLEADPRRSVRSVVVRRFELGQEGLSIEAADGRKGSLPYGRVDLVLAATGAAGTWGAKESAEREPGVAEALRAGRKKSRKKQERGEPRREERREEVLCLRAGTRPFFVFPQFSMEYDGLGTEMKVSSELNIHYLLDELKRRCPAAVHDDRLLRRAGLTRLLGPSFDPEKHLPLAMEVLARGLMRRTEAPSSP